MYTDKQLLRFSLSSADLADTTINDDTDIAGLAVIPANKEITILSVKGYVHLASDGADTIELALQNDTVLSEISVETTGHKTGTGTFPLKVAPATAARLLKLKMNGVSDATSQFDFFVEVSGL